MDITQLKFDPAAFTTEMLTQFEVPLILRTDSYKLGHYDDLVEGLEYTHIYLESRYGMSRSMFAGIQYTMKRFFNQKITKKMVKYCKKFAETHGLSFNEKGWDTIVKRYDGKLPIEIRAVDEGTVVPISTPMLVIVNTDPEFAWLPPYFEALIQRIWNACSVATRSFEQKLILKKYAEMSMAPEDIAEYLMFALHDFGPRGASSAETSVIGGMSHLMNFKGSDNLEAIYSAIPTYGVEGNMAAYSIHAIEHNVVLSWGEDREFEMYEYLCKKYLQSGRKISIVIDTFDMDRAVKFFISIKDKIEQWWRDGGKKGGVVLRPDSGHPVDIPVSVVLQVLEGYGYTTNSKGKKVLPPYMRVIQGDGTDPQIIERICELLVVKHNVSICNIVFGQGGKLLQAHSRDDGGYAMKNSVNVQDGVTRFTSKRPKTDSAKTSKEGYFKAYVDDTTGEVTYIQVDSMLDTGLLTPVYRVGDLVKDHTLDTVRDKADSECERLKLIAA